MRGRKVVPLAPQRVRRLERRLDAAERRLRDLGAQLDQSTELLTRLVRVVAVHSRQSRRALERLDERLRRIARDVASGRTADVRRVTTLARRLAAVEARR